MSANGPRVRLEAGKCQEIGQIPCSADVLEPVAVLVQKVRLPRDNRGYGAVAEGLSRPRKRAKHGKPSAWLRLKLEWSCGREAEGGGLLNRYRVVKPYRGFESLRLRQFSNFLIEHVGIPGPSHCSGRPSLETDRWTVSFAAQTARDPS